MKRQVPTVQKTNIHPRTTFSLGSALRESWICQNLTKYVWLSSTSIRIPVTCYFRNVSSLHELTIVCVHAKSLQSCLTLCSSMDCSLTGSSVHGTPGKHAGVGGHALLQGIFPAQGLSPRLLRLLHCQAVSLPLVPLINIECNLL